MFPSDSTCRRWSKRKVKLLNKLPRVLVVDDHPDSAEALATLLSYESIETRVAPGCDAALSCVRVWFPDVIVLDIKLHGHDGFETAKLLREYLSTESLGILAYTSFDQDYLIKKGGLGDFDGYCRKGNSHAALLALMRQLWED